MKVLELKFVDNIGYFNYIIDKLMLLFHNVSLKVNGNAKKADYSVFFRGQLSLPPRFKLDYQKQHH
jgi:hypothetical protein